MKVTCEEVESIFLSIYITLNISHYFDCLFIFRANMVRESEEERKIYNDDETTCCSRYVSPPSELSHLSIKDLLCIHHKCTLRLEERYARIFENHHVIASIFLRRAGSNYTSLQRMIVLGVLELQLIVYLEFWYCDTCFYQRYALDYLWQKVGSNEMPFRLIAISESWEGALL